jgi:hypothetical protein
MNALKFKFSQQSANNIVKPLFDLADFYFKNNNSKFLKAKTAAIIAHDRALYGRPNK